MTCCRSKIWITVSKKQHDNARGGQTRERETQPHTHTHTHTLCSSSEGEGRQEYGADEAQWSITIHPCKTHPKPLHNALKTRQRRQQQQRHGQRTQLIFPKSTSTPPQHPHPRPGHRRSRLLRRSSSRKCRRNHRKYGRTGEETRVNARKRRTHLSGWTCNSECGRFFGPKFGRRPE